MNSEARTIFLLLNDSF